MVTPIENLTPMTPISVIGKQTDVQATGVEDSLMAKAGESIFGAIFKNAIDNVKETDAEFTEAQYLLSTGQLDNPATALIAYTKEEVAVNLLIQLRNRAMDAYSELTRMSI